MYYVYILKSLKDNKRYIGYTQDIEKRVKEHNRGKSLSVKNRGPFDLIHKEEFNNKAEAIKREKEIKSFKGGNQLKKILAEKL